MARQITAVQDYLLKTLVVNEQVKTRDELSKESGFARTTVFDNLTKMILEGMIVSKNKIRATKGRRLVFYMSFDSVAILNDDFD